MGRLLLIRCLALAFFGSHAYAEESLRHFDIQSQAAASALNEFARQADITLVFSSALVAKHQTPAIHGDFTVIDGLKKLLDGTGLSFNQVSASTIAISAGEVHGSSDPPATSLDTADASVSHDEPETKGSNMKHRGFLTRLVGLFAVGGGLLAGSHGFAQTTTAPAAPASPEVGATTDASAANTNTLDEIVVTGAAESKGLKKLDASFSITTASLEEIRDVNPSSSADLLKIVPGIWAESSAGASGANIELAGFPGGGDAPYVTYAINGSPVFPSSGNISFMDNSSQFRLDESVERAEVLQGGPGVVLANGQMGATANFILRQGTATPHGDIGITYGFEGMYRLDTFYSGPISQDWFFSIGGFYRDSNGIRNSQYPADDGGQITGTLTHTLDNGTIMFFARDLNDKNLFITDIPVNVSGTGSSQSVSAFPGFNPGTGTFAGSGLRSISVQETPTGAPVTADLAKGRGANLHNFGSDLDLDLTEGISLSNKLMFSAGEVDCYCLFNNLPPQTLSSFIAGEIATANANAAITSVAGLASTGTAKLVSTGAALSPDSYVASLGFWIVQKQIQSFTDDLRFTFDLFEGDKLTVGGYWAAYSSDDHWWLGNNELITGNQNAQLIDLTLNNGVNVTNPAGQLGASFFTLVENWTGRNTALFVSDQWKINSWIFDAGYRIEQQVDHGTIENDSAVNLDDNPLNLYNKGVSVPNGTFTQGVSCETSGTNECTEYNHTFGSWSVGANYEITPHMSVYGRINQGVHFPGFDDLRSGTPQTQGIKNYEVGYRVQTPEFYGVVSLWHRTFTGVPFQQFTSTGENITATYGAVSTGTDFEARYEPITHLTFDLSGDWQHATYSSYDSGTAGGDYTGLTLQRQPRLQFRITPGYEIPFDWGGLRFFATYTHVGLRYSDIANQQVLPSYYTLDAGAVAQIGHNVEIRVQGSNLTDQLGLTEGNARVQVGTGSGITDNIEMVRPIFGREVNIQLRYKF
jgi:outer membrane receptor protein involved in Fe transport